MHWLYFSNSLFLMYVELQNKLVVIAIIILNLNMVDLFV